MYIGSRNTGRKESLRAYCMVPGGYSLRAMGQWDGGKPV